MPLTLRPARLEDAPRILGFITELATYERAAHEVVASVEDIHASLFAADALCRALICERDGQPIGCAIYFYSYSTWLGRKGIYLEELYISPEHRGSGAGRLLLQHIAREAVEAGYGRVEWSVLDWNEPAIGFYRTLGAVAQDEWVKYRLEGEALRAFARG